MEVTGITQSVPANELGSMFYKILEKVEVEIPEKNIDSWHRVGNQGSNIDKFHRRKKIQKVLNVKNNIQKITAADLVLPGSIKLYLNESLCPCYWVLWSKSKTLYNIGNLKIYFTSNGSVKIRLQELSPVISIIHVSDFEKYFPGVDLSALRWIDLLYSSPKLTF